MDQARLKYLITRDQVGAVSNAGIYKTVAFNVVDLVLQTWFIFAVLGHSWLSAGGALVAYAVQKIWIALHHGTAGVCTQCGGVNRPAGVLLHGDVRVGG